MDELVKALEKERIDELDVDKPNEFTQAAIDWAAYSLRHFNGKLLKKALSISVAMIEYDIELLK